MRRFGKKLTITAETIRRLERPQLVRIAGGGGTIGCGATQHPHTACDPIDTFNCTTLVRC